jgi:hypothetical protein
LVGGFVPDEGFWVSVVVLDEVVDGGLEFLGGAMDGAAELALGEQDEPDYPSRGFHIASIAHWEKHFARFHCEVCRPLS